MSITKEARDLLDEMYALRNPVNHELKPVLDAALNVVDAAEAWGDCTCEERPCNDGDGLTEPFCYKGDLLLDALAKFKEVSDD